jgi:hypothetical protein
VPVKLVVAVTDRECFEKIAAFAAGRKLRLANPEVGRS